MEEQSAAFVTVEEAGTVIVESRATLPVTAGESDTRAMLEACFAAGARELLVHAEHLPPAFFDLSSRQAGTLLQKLRQYGVRLAVVAVGDGVPVSSRFGEMVAEEARGPHFRLFESREAAAAWLARHDGEDA